MMTILYQTPIMVERNELIAVISIVMVFIFSGLTICMLIEGEWIGGIITICAVILGIIGISYGSKKISINKNRYEVLIDESYPAEELYENYIIVEQRGKIYVLEDMDVQG